MEKQTNKLEDNASTIELEKTPGCPFINGEDCFENLQSCNDNYEKCLIYHAKKLKYNT